MKIHQNHPKFDLKSNAKAAVTKWFKIKITI